MSESGYQISERVAQHWLFAFGDDGQAVVADGSLRLNAAVARWGLADLSPMSESYWGSVFSAFGPDGCPVVLKVNPRTPGQKENWISDHESEPQALGFWTEREQLAPRVYQTAHAGSTYLMEHCLPGTTLREANLSSLETVQVLGVLAQRLHGCYEDGDSLGLAAQRLRDFHKVRKWETALAGTREAGTLQSLLATSDYDALLHTDLHGDNVVLGDGRWKAIDPIPVIGDRHAEIYALIFHPAFLQAVPSGQTAARNYVEAHLSTYCEAAGLDFDRAAAWLRCRLLYRIWRAERENDPEDETWTRYLPRIVELLPEAALQP